MTSLKVEYLLADEELVRITKHHSFFLICTALVLTAGCTNSNPAIELLEKKLSPTRGGLPEWFETISDLSQPVLTNGECDLRASMLEYSADGGSTWANVNSLSGSESDCSDGRFSLTIPQSLLSFQEKVSDRRTLLIRQYLGGAATTSAIVTIKYVAPRGPRPDGLRIVLGKLKPEPSLPFDIKMRAYARGAAR